MKWFAGALFLLVASLVLQSGLLAYAMYVLLATLLLTRLMARSWIGKVTARRQFRAMVMEVGDKLQVQVEVENQGWLPVPWVLLEDLLPAGDFAHRLRLQVKGKRARMVYLGSRGESTLEYEIRFKMRGYYQIGPVVLESGDLFGLHRRYRVATEPEFVLVLPRVVPIAGYELATRRPLGEIRLTHRLFEDPTRIAGVRQYQAGDPMNRVHWATTARTGILHSKVFEPSCVAGATLVLDFHHDAYPREREPQRSDVAVTAAASLAYALDQLGEQLGLISNGRDAAERIASRGWEHDFRTRQAALQSARGEDPKDRLQPQVVETRRGPEQFQKIRELLARVELNDGLPMGPLLLETASRMPRSATVLALLGEGSEETVLALGNLRRRGYAVTAVLVLFTEEEKTKVLPRLIVEGIGMRMIHTEADVATVCQELQGVRS